MLRHALILLLLLAPLALAEPTIRTNDLEGPCGQYLEIDGRAARDGVAVCIEDGVLDAASQAGVNNYVEYLRRTHIQTNTDPRYSTQYGMRACIEEESCTYTVHARTENDALFIKGAMIRALQALGDKYASQGLDGLEHKIKPVEKIRTDLDDDHGAITFFLPEPAPDQAQDGRARRTTAFADAACGYNNGFVRICYGHNQLNAYAPSNRVRPLRDYVLETSDTQGYAVIIMTSARDSTDGIGKSRALTLQRELIGQQVSLKADNRLARVKPVIYSVVEAREENAEPVGYILSREDYERLQNDPDATELVARAGVVFSASDTEAAALSQWQTDRQDIAEDVQELKEDIHRKHHIIVRGPLINTQGWTLSDIDTLRAELARPPLSIDTLQPCTAYLLVDQAGSREWTSDLKGLGGAHLLQSRYCALTPRMSDVDRARPGEEEVALLESALHRTRSPDPWGLQTIAYALATENKPDEAQALILHINNEWDNAALEHTNGIVNAKIAMVTGNHDAAENILEAKLPQSNTSLRGQGAADLITLYTREPTKERCAKAANVLERYEDDLRERFLLPDAQGRVRECSLEQIERTCDILGTDQDDHPLQITIINDGIDQGRFPTLAARVRERILDRFPISGYADRIEFRTAESPQRIAQTTGTGRPPRVDQRALAQARTGCAGDYTIVLSEHEYEHVIYPGSGLVSTANCGEGNDHCVAAYSIRALAHGLFRLDKEDGTYTGSASPYEGRNTFETSFSQQQITKIIAFLEAYR